MMLYHYCDNKKMANIVAEHTLRMSDITKSNDYEEIQLFYPYIMTAIEKEYKMNPFSLDYKGEKDFEALKRLLHVTHKLVNIEFDVGEMTISREELQSVIADKAKEVLLNLQNDIGWIVVTTCKDML